MIILKFVIPYFIFFVLICVPIYITYYKQYKENFLYNIDDIMDNVSLDISRWISEYKTQLKTVNNFFETDMSVNDMMSAVYKMKTLDKELVDIYFGGNIPYADGGVFVSAIPDTIPSDYDQTTRDWYINSVNTNDVYVSEAYTDVSTSSTSGASEAATSSSFSSFTSSTGSACFSTMVEFLFGSSHARFPSLSV